MLDVQEGLLVHMSGSRSGMAGRAGGWPRSSLSLHVASLSFLTVHTWQLASPRGNTFLRVIMGDGSWVGFMLPHKHPSVLYGLTRDVIFFMEPFMEAGKCE